MKGFPCAPTLSAAFLRHATDYKQKYWATEIQNSDKLYREAIYWKTKTQNDKPSNDLQRNFWVAFFTLCSGWL